MAQVHRVETQADALKQHRRETQLQILLPLAGGAALLVVALVIVMLLPRFIQVKAVSDFLVTLLLLCPLALCLLPLALALTVAALAMNRVHTGTAGLLGRLVTLSDRVSTRFDSAADTVAHKAIDVSVKLAPLEKQVFGAFDRPPIPPNEVKHVPTALPKPRDQE